MRPFWDEYFLQIAELVATRSTCVRHQYGCVIVRDKQILATGYNGSVSGAPHCEDIGCLRSQMNIPHGQRYELCRSIHAEQNALLQAAKHGVAVNGACVYVTGLPCYMCAKQIANAGIACVICKMEDITYGVEEEFYRATLEVFEQAGVEITQIYLDAKG